MDLLLSKDDLKTSLVDHLADVNFQLNTIYGEDPLDDQEIIRDFIDHADQLQAYIKETGIYAAAALSDGKVILAEGAQGTLLDLDHGTYPYVTSSTPTAPGALIGLGLGIGSANRVVGVVKAFQTRVGEGPFPTELDGELAERLRGTGENEWDEFGTTTGRPRRVGWLDLVLLRYAVRINGITEIALTKLDILSGFDKIQICTAYQVGKKTTKELPLGPGHLEDMKGIYEDLPGWTEDLTAIRAWGDLPEEARHYIETIESSIGVPVTMISVGPERSQVILR
jgi:adenylosuccinate synthase